jgi:aspartyl-tRNA(Asn)/glutamyl-tRNA(Gln) amidotransferase subunit C
MPSSANINIEYLAKLARIALNEDEKRRFANELEIILKYFQELDNPEVAGKVAGITPSAHAFPVFNTLREDQPGPLLDTDALAKIAPAFRDAQVLVPRVVDDEG